MHHAPLSSHDRELRSTVAPKGRKRFPQLEDVLGSCPFEFAPKKEAAARTRRAEERTLAAIKDFRSESRLQQRPLGKAEAAFGA